MSNEIRETPTACFLCMCMYVFKSTKVLERDTPIVCSLGRGLKLGWGVIQEHVSLICNITLFSLEELTHLFV